MISTSRFLLPLTIVVALAWSDCHGTTIQFDYSMDGGFFGSGPARDSLIAAGQVFESILSDQLDAITPSPGNTWTALFDDPGTGDPAAVFGLDVPADTLIVFVGSRDLLGSAIGLGGPGGYSANGTTAWLDIVDSRGQGTTSGPTADDFGPWGGMLTVDDQVTWNLDHTLLPTAGEHDLFSVLLHELGHVLGVGIASSWFNQVAGNTFTGTASVASYGGAVPLAGDNAHWQNGVTSTVFGGATSQEAALDPSIAIGSRKLFTELDVAGLEDLGWQANPEPNSAVLIVIGIMAVLAQRRRSQVV